MGIVEAVWKLDEWARQERCTISVDFVEDDDGVMNITPRVTAEDGEPVLQLGLADSLPDALARLAITIAGDGSPYPDPDDLDQSGRYSAEDEL